MILDFSFFQNGGLVTGGIPPTGRPPNGVTGGTVGKKSGSGGIAAKLSNHFDRLVSRGGSIRGEKSRTGGFHDVTFNREYSSTAGPFDSSPGTRQSRYLIG